MDWIDRYLYALTKSFSGKQKEEIEKEFRANIEDMVALDKSAASREEKVKKVLAQLGDPAAIADAYRGTERYVIGPRYYSVYLTVLKIVLLAVGGSVSIAVFIQSILSGEVNYAGIIAGYFAFLFAALLQAFACTTIAFFLAERKSEKTVKTGADKAAWTPDNLPPLTDRKADITASKTLVNITFTAVFFSLLVFLFYYMPDLFAAYFGWGPGAVAVPLFDSQVMRGYMGLWVAILALSLLRAILPFFYRRWNLKLALSHSLVTVLTTVFAVIIFGDGSLWNPDFAPTVARHMQLSVDFTGLWESVKRWFIVVIVMAGALDLAGALYKGIRYRNNK